MKENLTDISYIMDASGSMASLKNDVIGGFNTFIKEQKETDGEANLTVVFFNHEYKLFLNGKNVKEVAELTNKDYSPSGMTALYDAVGKTITEVGLRLSETPEELRPSKVIFIIMTDGQENSSKNYNADQIKSMIELQKNTYNWEFVFVGANQDTALSAETIGVDNWTSFSCAVVDGVGVSTMNAYATMSKCVSNYRGVGDIGDLPDDIK